MGDLGTLGEEGQSSATGINDAGQVVGWARTSGPIASHAFITGPDGLGMTDLNSLVSLPEGVILMEAVDINDARQVLAIALIPEPEIYGMLLAGLNLIGLISRREKMLSRAT